MFSFPRPGCVQTGKQGYAYVFDSSSGESYIFLDKVANGAQSSVQLVANIFTHEVAIRKVSKTQPRLIDERGCNMDITKLAEEPEIRIVKLLDSLVKDPINKVPDTTPRFATCIFHEDIPTMTDHIRPTMVCSRVSYWKLCNGGSLAAWVYRDDRESPIPISIIARAIAQVCESLHFMYTAGREAIYHCDLHLGNVFMHYDESRDDGLPDFYIGDFGWSRTASESLADSVNAYGNSIKSWETLLLSDSVLPPPGTAPPSQRRRWDMDRFGSGIQMLLDMGTHRNPPSEQVKGLERLVTMLEWLDNQEEELAARNPRSRPHSLTEFIREARKLERKALAAEQNTEGFKQFIAAGKQQAHRIMKEKRPHVFPIQATLPPETRRTQAEGYGRTHIEGPWSLMESI